MTPALAGYQNSRDAIRAPAAMAASLAHTMSGSTAAWPTQEPFEPVGGRRTASQQRVHPRQVPEIGCYRGWLGVAVVEELAPHG